MTHQAGKGIVDIEQAEVMLARNLRASYQAFLEQTARINKREGMNAVKRAMLFDAINNHRLRVARANQEVAECTYLLWR